jgi:hypothetical protein
MASQLMDASNCQNGSVTFHSSQNGWLPLNPARTVGYLSIQPEWLVTFRSSQNGLLPFNPARMVGYFSIQPEWLVTFKSIQNG